ncbi:uncharacterized protein [Montipora capricornis]|uniref:uncharacterized protein n=1 Tax=Montipora capricornis TaxID=246305 RepID=UPI0035F1E6A8
MFYNNFECSIILENFITEAFLVNSGVRQGCILSPIILLVTIDWVMRQTTSERPREIQWTLFSHLKYLLKILIDVLSSTPAHLQEKSDDLNMNAKMMGLTISNKKNATRPVSIDGEPSEHIEEFTYLGSVISTDSSVQRDIKSRTSSPGLHLVDSKTSESLNSIALRLKCPSKTVTLSLCYCMALNVGGIFKRDISKVSAFHNSCLRKINNIFCSNKISNNDLYLF